MKATLTARILFAALLTVSTVAISYFGIIRVQSRLSSQISGILSDNVARMDQAQSLKQSFIMHDDLIFRYLSAGIPSYLDEGLAMRKKIRREIKKHRESAQNPVESDILTELAVQSRKYFEDAGRLVQIRQTAGRPSSLPSWFVASEGRTWMRRQDSDRAIRLLSAEGQNRLSRLYFLCDKLVDLSRSRMSNAQAEMSRIMDVAIRRARAFSLAAGMAVLLIALWLSATVSRPLRRFIDGVRRVMEGDLYFKIPASGPGEIGELTHSFNTMTGNLSRTRDQLFQESVTDHLTGIHNLRHFQKTISQEVGRADRYRHSVSLLIADIDHFKNLNDTYGHETGNLVLKQVVNVLKNNVREIDFLARYGGEEFAVLLPNATPEEGQNIAQKLREAVAHSQFPGMEIQPLKRLTISIGGATYPDGAVSDKDLILKADKALYEAKSAGRNRVRWYAGAPPDLQEHPPIDLDPPKKFQVH